MLVMSRKEGESISIGNDIRILLLKCKLSGRVILGIDAPQAMPVFRSELLEAKRPELPQLGIDIETGAE